MKKDGSKPTRSTEPFQIRWPKDVKDSFERLVEDYDSHLSVNNAIQKLVEYALHSHWLPGYEKKDKPLDDSIKVMIDSSHRRNTENG